MHKAAKRIIAGIVVAAVVCGGIYGGLTLYRNSQVRPVAVYQVSELVMPAEYYMEDSQSYGSVSADRIQSVFISSTQNVKEVLVEEGQMVKRGDPLLTYDTTLTAIQLERAENALAQEELALKRAEEDLEKIKRLVPSSESDYSEVDVAPEPTPTPTPKPKPPVQYDPQETGVRVRGKGTYENPYVYLWSSIDALTNDQLLAMFTESGVVYHIEETAKTVTEDNSSEVESAREMSIFKSFPLLPLTVYGDEEIQAGVEDGQEDEVFEVAAEAEMTEEELEVEMDASPDEGEFIEYPVDFQEEVPDVQEGEEEEAGVEFAEEEFDLDLDAEGNPVVINVETESTPEENPGSYQSSSDYSFLDGAPNEVYVVLEIHESNNINAPLLLKYYLHLIRDGHSVAVRLYNPDTTSKPEDVVDLDEDDSVEDDEDFFYDDYDDYDDDFDEDEDEDEEDYAPSLSRSAIDFEAHYTAKEIEEMRKEMEEEVRDNTISFKLSQISLKEMQREMADGSVRSKIDGVVKTVRDPGDAFNNSEAVVVVSGGGGYSVSISVSELELDSLAIDQEVEITSFDTDITYPGYVVSISDYPSSGMDGWSMGNPNSSYYPCVVNASENVELREGDYVSVKYKSLVDDGNSFFMERMFVRSDNSGRYVYVRGKEGLLTKRYIVTGKSPDSYIIEVRGGLLENEYVAFPYGTNVKDGAPVEMASIDDLYA